MLIRQAYFKRLYSLLRLCVLLGIVACVVSGGFGQGPVHSDLMLTHRNVDSPPLAPGFASDQLRGLVEAFLGRLVEVLGQGLGFLRGLLQVV